MTGTLAWVSGGSVDAYSVSGILELSQCYSPHAYDTNLPDETETALELYGLFALSYLQERKVQVLLKYLACRNRLRILW